MQLYVGCSGFYNKDWKEVFYPKGLPQRKWFEYYSTQFNSLELNTTFYRFPRIDFLKKWYDASPPNFKFSVKAPRLITHYKQFKESQQLLTDFYSTIKEGLKEKLGAVLFQLPSRIIYTETFLQRIIESVNSEFVNVFEFRHTSWWNDNVFSQLSKHNISFCGISIKDLPDDVVATTQTIYYRFHGIEKLYFSEYPVEIIKTFAEKLNIKSKNSECFYIYFNNTATIAAIHNAQQLIEVLKSETKSNTIF
jgi:uncharacterized protein YecE (DUF72 family)